MNHHRQAPLIRTRLSLPALAFALLIGGACAATAQAQRAGGLPADVKSAPNAAPHAKVIEQFVATQVKGLLNEKDATAQQRARDLLIREVGGAGAAPSPSFLDLYATTLNKALLPLASPKLDPRVRLNAAIVLHRVGAKANNARLAEAATAFVQDPCFGCALWAVKASQPILPPLATAGQASKLPAAIVDAVKKNPTSGELVEEAYKALTLGGGFRNINENSVRVVTPQVLRLLALRVGQYAKETPPQPLLEQYAVRHLTLGRVWETKEGARLRPAIMQELSNLIGVTAQHAAFREANDRQSFVTVLKDAGDGLMQLAKRPDMAGADFDVVGKSLASMSNGMDENEFTDRAEAAHAAIKGKFPNVKPFPVVDPEAANQSEEPVFEEEPTVAGAAGAAQGAGTAGGAAAGAEAAPGDDEAGGGDDAGAGKTGGTGAAGTGTRGGTDAGTTGGTNRGNAGTGAGGTGGRGATPPTPAPPAKRP